MKPDIHPKYSDLTIIMTNGDKFKTKSTYDKSELLLDVDFRTHSAWSGGISQVNENASNVAKFTTKFAGINFSTKKQDTKTNKKENNSDKNEEDSK